MKAQFKGVDGKMELLDDRVVIKKSGIFGGQDTQFYLSQIDGIEYAKSSMINGAKGHIAILSAGYGSYPVPKKNVKDDPRLNAKNLICFWYTSNGKAEEFKTELDRAVNVARQPNNSGVAIPIALASSGADEIAKFKALLDSGAISQDEYDAKKKQLLGI